MTLWRGLFIRCLRPRGCPTSLRTVGFATRVSKTCPLPLEKDTFTSFSVLRAGAVVKHAFNHNTLLETCTPATAPAQEGARTYPHGLGCSSNDDSLSHLSPEAFEASRRVDWYHELEPGRRTHPINWFGLSIISPWYY